MLEFWDLEFRKHFRFVNETRTYYKFDAVRYYDVYGNEYLITDRKAPRFVEELSSE